MNIGDKVRFLNDIGGGKITAFRAGGIVMVEDEDGFDIPVAQDEIVVVESTKSKVEQKQSKPHVEYGAPPIQEQSSQKGIEILDGKQYLQSKTVHPSEEDKERDENAEARIVRLELTIQKLETSIHQLESRIAKLEAENNLRRNEKMMVRREHQGRPTIPQSSSKPTTNMEKLQIL